MNWQPIETAPHAPQKRPILMWAGDRPWVAYWHDLDKRFVKVPGHWPSAETPTHWCEITPPLPRPPADNSAEEKAK